MAKIRVSATAIVFINFNKQARGERNIQLLRIYNLQGYNS